jgi:NifU-like protein involved in Fe-S cluster formation
MYIKVRGGRIVDIKYQVQGCGAAIATCSALSEIAIGKTSQEAWRLTDDDIAAELGGLPLEKLHCLWRNSAAPTWLQLCCIEPSLIMRRTHEETCATGKGCISG